MTKFLTREGMNVRAARTGTEALEALSAGEFDVILLDLRMPHVDGFGVLRALRANGDMPAVLIHSAYLDVKTVTRAMREGAADVVEKPCDLTELVQKIHGYAGSGPTPSFLDSHPRRRILRKAHYQSSSARVSQ